MKLITTFSGGKDSLAALLWAKENISENFETVFCDTGWESEITYKYIQDVAKQLGIKVTVLKSKKYNGFIDLAKKKGRFPSTRARFCTVELKTIPMIDYILDEVNDDILIIQGIRGGESHTRSLMSKQAGISNTTSNPTRLTK